MNTYTILVILVNLIMIISGAIDWTSKDYCSFENGPICNDIPHIACLSSEVSQCIDAQ